MLFVFLLVLEESSSNRLLVDERRFDGGFDTMMGVLCDDVEMIALKDVECCGEER
jgi:hypothetical protein